jgi:hypothetical protein
MATYWVTGGEYASTDFREMAKGSVPQRFGPFKTYEEARAAWLAHSFANVDNCHVRFTIIRDDEGSTDKSASAA